MTLQNDIVKALSNEVTRLREFIKSMRINEHYECEDPWYSCPKHPGYRGGDDRTHCSCGMDRTNAEIDKVLKGGE